MSNGNNPYAPDAFNQQQPGSARAADPFGDNAPRISKMAITSLVLALICCIPPLPSLAVAFGAGALIRIRGANGRLSGTVLAIFGVVLGLIFSAIQIAVIIGAVQIYRNVDRFVSQPARLIVADVAKNDPTNLRALLDPASKVTDAQITDWFARVNTELGAFKGETARGDAAMAIQDASQRAAELGSFPLPAPVQFTFEKGDAGLVFFLPSPEVVVQTMFFGKDPRSLVTDIALVTPDGKVIRLRGSPLTAPAPAPQLPSSESPAP
jgi:hypothetical protein